MTTSNTTLFKQAHAMTRATIQNGDDYRATFGLCLKALKADKQSVSAKAKKVAKAIYNVVTDVDIMVFVALILGFIMLLVGFNHVNTVTNDYRQQAKYTQTIEQAASYNYLNRFNDQ